MTQPPSQPQPDDAASRQVQNLDAQLEQVLSDIEQQEPGLIHPSDKADQDNQSADQAPGDGGLMDKPVEEAIDEAQQLAQELADGLDQSGADSDTGTPDNTTADDEALADQLQARLEGRDDPATAPAGADPVTETAELVGDFHAPDQSVIDAAAAAITAGSDEQHEEQSPAPQPAAPVADTSDNAGGDCETSTIEQLDQVLADNADDEMDGSFEPVQELLDTEQADAPPQEETEAAPEPVEATAVETPEPVAEPASQPEPSAEPASQSEPSPAPAEPVAVVEASAPKIRVNPAAVLEKVVVVESVLQRTCYVINRPVQKLPREMREMVGWVAIAVAGPGLIVLLWGLLT